MTIPTRRLMPVEYVRVVVLAAGLCALTACGGSMRSLPADRMILANEYAYLQNAYDAEGGSAFKYVFTHADDDKLPSGENFYNGTDRRELTHPIAPGPTVLGLRVEYYHVASRHPFGVIDTGTHYDIFVRDIGGFPESELMNESERASVAGLNGITIDAEPGHVYRIRCRVENGRAQVWIEEVGGEDDGEPVSEPVIGLGARVFFERSWWVWQSLPDPIPDYRIL